MSWLRIACINFFLWSPYVGATVLTEQQHRNLETAISICENKLLHIKKAGAQITRLPTPQHIHASWRAKLLYRMRLVERHAYLKNVEDYQRLLQQANIIRSEEDFLKQRAMLQDFSSNCKRFADGIVAFARFIKTGKAPDRTHKTIFQDHLNEAKRELLQGRS